MKRLFIVPMLLMQVLWVVGQNIDQSVELILNSKVPCNVPISDSPCTIKMRANRYGSSIELSAELDNNDEKYCMILFGRSFTEKELKRRKIKFHKRYGNFSRSTSVCDGVDDDIFEIAPSQTGRLEVSHVSDNSYKWTIALYITEQKKRKRIILRRRDIVLHVTIKDAETIYGDYNAISSRCDEIIAKVGLVTICPGRNHGLTKEEQKAPYLEKIDELKQEIEQIREKNHWRDTDSDFQRYSELLSRLDAIVFQEERCSRCLNRPYSPTPSHQCDYCNTPPEAIKDQVVSIYRDLDARRTTKSEAKQRATRLRNLWTGGCPKLQQKMINDARTQRKAESYYNSICNY